MLVCVGLGNPGRGYAKTRHNLGFMVLDALAGDLEVRWKAEKGVCFTAEGMIGDAPFRMVKPTTYMNRAGRAVREMMERYAVPPDRILVVVDDVNLTLGRLRLRRKGSAGGHNGLASIIAQVGSEDFPRLRLGIGMPESGDRIEYVLGAFDETEWPTVRETIDRAVEGIRRFVLEGPDAAMDFCNAG
ncbi:MAG: aminoacyl-tRNA hydrolase [Candidatus Latescibacteria bacterium]|nr:aminoacyl-tRNA hydrolase [Candidatus Latescibacterota bacterium]MCK5733007.1 aminoacyl-tRNA hydrolase [Candidatus Latescibacterota bacterium]